MVNSYPNSNKRFQSYPNLHSESLLKNLLNLDVIGLCVHLTVIVTNDIKYKEVVARRGSGAQSLLNLLQAVWS
jgi:hypothetical protein